MSADLARLRLVAQRLVAADATSPTDAVRWSTAMQAQDYAGAVTSVALRTRTRSRAHVIEVLDSGELVRSWPMRGTLHLTAAEDLPWLLRLLAPRVVRASTTRRTGLGLDQAQLEQGRDLAEGALSGGRRLRRAELFEVWKRAGLDPSGQRGVHVLRYLAMTGTLVFGPTAGGEQLLVLLDEWIPAQRPREREDALGELARRYFRSHGPATAADLSAWAGLTSGETRTALALARPSLCAQDVGGTEHLFDPQTPDRLTAVSAAADGVLLLPGFDEFLLGYRDRSAQLDPAHAQRVVPGGNGVFRPTVICAGRVIGTWARGGGAAPRAVTATAFTTLSPGVELALAAAAADLPVPP